MGGDGTSQTSGTDQNVEKSGYPIESPDTAPNVGQAGGDKMIGSSDHTVKMSDN